MFFLDTRLALLAVALVVLALGVSVTVNLLRQRLEREHLQITGMNAGGIFQALSGIAKLRACGAERRAFTRWATGAAREKTVFLRLRRLGNLLRAVEAGQTVFCALMLYGATVALSPDIAP
jgi:ABC-type bacteriocin/lantibiotic exporter with double-glycine peptidase domain